jgi:hypothetical protein
VLSFNSQFLKQPVFWTGTEIRIPVMPLFWNVSLNSDVVFWPHIQSGFVAEKTDTFDCRFYFVFLFSYFAV